MMTRSSAPSSLEMATFSLSDKSSEVSRSGSVLILRGFDPDTGREVVFQHPESEPDPDDDEPKGGGGSGEAG